jgi:DNA-binding transcriptional ArsR family regulator
MIGSTPIREATMARKRSPPLSVREAARLFRLLGKPARLRLLLVLRDQGEAWVGDLIAAAGLSRYVARRHLPLLRRRGVIGHRKAGQRAFYRITSPLVLDLLRDVGEG